MCLSEEDKILFARPGREIKEGDEIEQCILQETIGAGGEGTERL